jgi:hypothetical protein
MQAFVMLFLVVAALMSNGVYSLPAINFTDSALPNQMIKTLSEALAAQNEQEQQQQQQAAQVDPRSKIKNNFQRNMNFIFRLLLSILISKS